MFLSVLSDLKSPSTVTGFINDLLSPTEQVMLGKRLAIAYMLKKGYTQRAIENTLKVSLTTVNKVNQVMKSHTNGYNLVIERMLKIQKISDFFDKLDEKLDHLLPPKGANWSDHYKRTYAARAKKKRAF